MHFEHDQDTYSGMITLDQRILIPAAPHVVWEYISDLSNNPQWQADCHEISFLTTFHKGQGTRWRSGGARRHETVSEITAWYDGLGYEYVVIDGAPFRQNKGRLRLQEIAEGTIVQWTLNYEPGGMLGGLRNALSIKNSMNTMLVENLRGLWKQITKSPASQERHVARTLMRDAPDVEERALYKPRHVSALSEHDHDGVRGDVPVSPMTAAPVPQPPAAILDMAEPPLADDDTRPSQTVHIVQNADEPDFLNGVTAFEDSDLVEPDNLAVVAAKPTAQADERFKPPSNQPVVIPAVASTEFSTPAPTAPVPLQQEPEPRAAVPTPAEPLPLERLPLSDEEREKVDTSKISVFELFGLPKPSETQEMRPLTADDLERQAKETQEPEPAEEQTETPTAAAMSATTEVLPIAAAVPIETKQQQSPQPESPTAPPWLTRRTGGRLRQRRQLVRLRLPK